MIISVFIPQGGCPERCSFCNQEVSGGDPTSLKNMEQTIEAHLESFDFKKKKKPGEEISLAFYGGTFTALRKELQLQYLDLAKKYFNRISSIRIATRSDAIEEDWISLLKKEYRLSVVELGVQSFNKNVLERLGRSHSLESVEIATVILRKHGITVGYHLMIGCPGELDWPSERELFKAFLKILRPDFVRIHPLLVLQGTSLEKDYQLGLFKPISLEEAIRRGADLMMDLAVLGIPVHRLGLQTNEEMLQGGVIAGPFHPSYGQLVHNFIENKSSL